MKKAACLFTCSWALLLITNAQPTASKKCIDPANMNLSVKPGDDFYQYVNGNWLKNNPVPASKSRWAASTVLFEESSNALRGLLENAAENPGKKTRLLQMVGDFYASGMDSIDIERAGYSPIKATLDEIGKLASLKDIINEMASLRVRGIASSLFGFFIGQDSKKVTEYIPQFGQGGTTLPDRDYYLKNDSKSIAIRNEYKSFITDLFKLTAVDSMTAKKNAADILELETKLANAQWSRVEMRDPQKLYNKFFVDDFSKTTKNINWRDFMAKLKVSGQDSIIISNPSFLRTADSLLTATPVETWKTYLQWYIIKNAAPYLSTDFVQRNFQFNKTLSGQKEITPRWQRMSSLTDGSLGDLLGQLYVAKYFKPEAKKRMLELVNNLQEALGNRIKRLDWMSDATKAKAISKLHAFSKKIGYTDKWKTYEGVEIKRNDLLGNIRSIAVWNYNDRISRLGKPVDKTEWNYTAPTINASYSPLRNEITFPAGILQAPFFNADADDAVNYGGIGAVIGHEMTHGFDDQGKQYDADGNLHNWWTEEDSKQFKSRADKVTDEYNAFTVLDTVHVNGKLTLGENIADLGGVNIAYEAFKNTAQGKSTEAIDGFTPDQRFFLNYAQIWRSNVLPETAARLIITDPHSPDKCRVNGILVNIDAFYKAFNIQPGDKMYRQENERIRIW